MNARKSTWPFMALIAPAPEKEKKPEPEKESETKLENTYGIERSNRMHIQRKENGK